MLSIKHLVFFLLLVLSQRVAAQVPVANFTATPRSGCAPLVVTFKDESSGSPISWNWDMGNGQLSNVQNPTVVFSQPGVYSIKLVVKNASGTHGVTKDSFIVVSPSPQADFKANTIIGCNPVNISFSDLSNDPAGSLTAWEWDFGDGTKSNQRNPQKNYTVNGFHNVTLTVTSSTGCQSTAGKSRYIRIVGGVKADFSNTMNGNCKPPFTANFNNQSAGPGSLTYAWDLGNGSTSTLKNPSTPYVAAGAYTVKLTTTSEFGCTSTTQKSVQVRSSSTAIGGPDSICLNTPLKFINNSNPQPESSTWYFDDGTQSSVLNPSKTYSASGPHVVKLVNKYAFCSDSITKTIYVVDPPTVDFTSSTILGCKTPLTVNFSDASPTTAISWAWDFGDGGKSTQHNPTHVYNKAGEFDVSLTITNSVGCTSKLAKSVFVKIAKPVLKIGGAPGEGCVPYTFNPVADVQSVDSVVSYSWEFGDGTGSTATSKTPSYTYNKSGEYTVKLTITTTGGCTESITVPGAVLIDTVPFTDFKLDTPISCASQAIRFTSLAKPATKWLWDFGDGSSTTEPNPVHRFSDTGTLAVTLSAYNNGCRGSERKLVKILSPFARFTDTILNCNDKFTVKFLDKSKVDPANNVAYLWKFSATDSSTNKEPSFTFPGPGVYPVSLTLVDQITGCSQTVTNNVTLIYEDSKFTASKTTVCMNEKLTLSASGEDSRIAAYSWRIGNGSFFSGTKSFDTSFSAPGKYSIELIVTNRNGGCTDTTVVTDMITVNGPIANFNTASKGSCVNRSVTFNDQSTSTVKLTKWTWDFGDKKTEVFTAPPFTHTYTDTGAYNIRLIVEDASGCTNTVTKGALVITKPLVNFGASDSMYCQGTNLQFTDSSEGRNLKYLWSFGDGGASTLQNPTHAYTGSDSTYSIMLKIADEYGCEDSLVRKNYVKIASPVSAFTMKDSVSICPPFGTLFQLQAKNYESFFMEFGDGGSVGGGPADSIVHFYNSYGSFTAKLFAYGNGGCVDSSFHSINVYNPSNTTSMTYSPVDACNSLNVDFAITAPLKTKFTFFYGDGTVDSSQAKTFSHFYSSPSFYSPSLLLYDSEGCQAFIGGSQQIRVLGAIPNFSRDKNVFCDSGTVSFTNYTIANDPIISSVWNFDDGATSGDTDPVHSFSKPDQYAVSLNVKTQAGCSSSSVDTIRVYRTPDPLINSINPACLNTPFLLKGSLAVADTAISWKWDLANGRASSLQDVTSIYSSAGTYKISLEAANALGCKKTITKDLVVAPLPVITMGAGPVIPVGTGIDLPVTYGNKMISYTWTPAKDLSCIDCPVPHANPKFTTQYKVAVTDSNHCKSSSEVTVKVVCNNKNYFVPNTFTPNSDGSNDVFYPRGSSIDRIQSLRVFNRWGQVVFEKKNFTANSITDGWNGMYQGRPAASDTYIYTIEFVCENGEIVPYRGNVTLLR